MSATDAPARGSESQVHVTSLVERVGDLVARVLLVLGAAFLAASVIITVVEVFFRYLLRAPFLSSEDLLSFAFTWLIFLGIPRSVWRGKAISLGVVDRYPANVQQLVRCIGEGGSMAFAVIIFISYLEVFPTQTGTMISTLHVPQYTDGIAVGIGMGLTFVLLLLRRMSRGVDLTSGLGLLTGAAAIVGLHFLPVPSIASGLFGLFLLVAADAPIAFALGAGGSIMASGGDLFQNLSVAASQMSVPTQNLALLAIPLFMFMGGIVARSRLSADLSRLVRHLLGWLPGGVGVACVGTAGIFANISGSAIADTAVIGSVFLPQLKRAGYPSEDAAALQAASGVVGVVFPPAIAMILFATVANVSVIAVFKAVIVPGLLLMLVMSAITVGHALRNGLHRAPEISWLGLARAIPASIPVLLIPIILDGGIFSGVFTPAESGAIAVVVSTVLITLMRGFSRQGLREAIEMSLDNTALVLFILVSVSILDYGFTTAGLSNAVTTILAGVTSQVGLLLLINLAFLIIHEFVDAGPSILVMVPLILPAVVAAGISPMQLAVVIAINSTIGAVLPPIGVNLYVSAEMAGANPRRVLPRVIPYVIGSAAVLLVVTVIPKLSLVFGGAA